MNMKKNYCSMSDEEIGRAIRLENEQHNEKQKLRDLHVGFCEQMVKAYKVLHDVYHGNQVRIRFAEITPQQMLLDIYLVEESLKVAREKICDYIDEIKKYEDQFQEDYKY